VVSHQLSPRQRHLHRLKESGACPLALCMIWLFDMHIAIFVHPSVHDLQELDYNTYCTIQDSYFTHTRSRQLGIGIRGSSMVRWQSHRIDASVLCFYGTFFSCLGVTRTKLFQVVSSIIAAWTDITSAMSDAAASGQSGLAASGFTALSGAVQSLNIGYLWMLANCMTSATYVGIFSWPVATFPELQ